MSAAHLRYMFSTIYHCGSDRKSSTPTKTQPSQKAQPIVVRMGPVHVDRYKLV